jgi:hypothetical protein
MLTHIAVMTKNLKSRWEAIILQPGIHAPPPRTYANVSAVTLSAPIYMVYTKKKRLCFSTASTDISSIRLEYFSLYCLILFSLPLSIFRTGFSVGIRFFITCAACLISILYWVFPTTTANLIGYPFCLEPFLRHLVVLPALCAIHISRIIAVSSALGASPFFFPFLR